MRVFISHAASDRSIADQIRDVLEREGLDVWNPRRELLPGSNWLLETGRALEQADAVVFLLPDDAERSPFTRNEFQYVMTEPKYERRVFPIQLGKRSANVPWILRDQVIHASGSNPAIAAREIVARLRGGVTARESATPPKGQADRSTPVKRRA